MAAHELLARQQGVPLYKVLGGRGGEIASGVSVGLQKDAAALVDKVAEEVAAGYRRVKIKIKPGKDRDLVAAIRARFPDMPLMVDANSAYTLDARAPLPRDGRLQPHDGRAAAGLERHRRPRGATEADRHPGLPRRVDPRSPDDARHALDLGGLPHHQRQGGTGGRPHPAHGHREPIAARAACPCGAGACWSRASAGSTTSTCRRCPGFTLPGDTSASARYFEEDLIDPPVDGVAARHDRGAGEARASATRSCGAGWTRRRCTGWFGRRQFEPRLGSRRGEDRALAAQRFLRRLHQELAADARARPRRSRSAGCGGRGRGPRGVGRAHEHEAAGGLLEVDGHVLARPWWGRARRPASRPPPARPRGGPGPPPPGR